MTDTVASEIARLGLELPTDVGTHGPLATLWAAEIDSSPPDPLTKPPPSLVPAGREADAVDWVVSQAIQLTAGIEARVYFLST